MKTHSIKVFQAFLDHAPIVSGFSLLAAAVSKFVLPKLGMHVIGSLSLTAVSSAALFTGLAIGGAWAVTVAWIVGVYLTSDEEGMSVFGRWADGVAKEGRLGD